MTLRLACGACLALVCGTVHPANLGFLGDAPISRMTKDDVDILYKAATETLDSNADGKPRKWGNPVTGAGGTLTPVDTFTGPDGARCRHLQVNNHAGGLKNKTRLAMCKQADGSWKASNK
jgi:surface antigen